MYTWLIKESITVLPGLSLGDTVLRDETLRAPGFSREWPKACCCGPEASNEL